MKALVLDGYTDEPACLGVPPFIAPYARLAYGALASAGAEVSYATIDQWRSSEVSLGKVDLLAVIRNISVPGKYLRGMPASDRELVGIARSAPGTTVASLGVAPDRAPRVLKEAFDHIAAMDLDACLHDMVRTGNPEDRRRTAAEWDAWSVRGAEACARHPDLGGPLIAEVQMYRGCVRYVTGGCGFCVEPLLGEVLFRPPEAVLREVEALSKIGVRNLRLGAQSCVYCYLSEEAGDSENPRPNVDAVSGLLKGIRRTADPEVFHLDNANPAVIAEHPEESRRITKAIVEHCTSGNVLAFGLESADPKVTQANNLNATAEQTLDAIRLVNQVGGERGASGLPHVLPGVNILCGLLGESRETYRLDFEFLQEVLAEGLMLRRINIRQVVPARTDFPGVRHRAEFDRFKRRVREHVDGPMLRRLVPPRTVMRSVYAELREGGRTFGRQAGTYPLLVEMPYPVPVGDKLDIAVTGTGFRSVVGVAHPTHANSASMSMLEAIPGIGRRRAMSIIRHRPFRDPEELWRLLDESRALESAQFHLALGDVDEN